MLFNIDKLRIMKISNTYAKLSKYSREWRYFILIC